MAILKRIKFGNVSNNIAKTVVTAKSGGVMSVGAPTGVQNSETEDADYQYELDVNVDGTTLVKSTTTGDNPVTQLAVGTVPAASVSVADSGDKFTATDVEAALAELKDNIDKVVSDGKTYSIVDDTANVQDLPTNVLKRYRLQQTVGSQSPTLVGANIDIPKDSSLKEVYLGASTDTINATTGVITKNTVTDPQSMNFAYQLADGTYELVKIDVSKFLTESEFGDGLEVSNAGVVSVNAGNGLGFDSSNPKKVQVVIDSTSADVEKFLSVGANGVKISGVQDAINKSIQALDVTTDAAVAGQYVAAIEETDGVVAVKTRANVSEAVLNNYTKGSEATAVAATDTVNQAISKLENQVDAAKSAASAAHSVVEKASGNTHVTVTASQPDTTTGAITYTIGETNIASASDLTAEVTRAQSAETAIDSAIGLTKSASGETRSFTPTDNYGTVSGTAATTVMGNMQNIDTALKAVSDKANSIQYKVDGTTLEFFGMTEKTGA